VYVPTDLHLGKEHLACVIAFSDRRIFIKKRGPHLNYLFRFAFRIYFVSEHNRQRSNGQMMMKRGFDMQIAVNYK
jgi:hypothetical protein